MNRAGCLTVAGASVLMTFFGVAVACDDHVGKCGLEAWKASRAGGYVAIEGSGNDASDVEIQRGFNDLRRELLDDGARTVDWWLAAVAIFLTFFGVVVVIVGYLGYGRFREIEAEGRGNVDRAREHAETAEKLVDEIKKKRDSLSRETTAEKVEAEPDKAAEAARSAQADPAASPIDRSVAAAILLQQQENIEEAIKKWRAIANIADGSDNELGARAWFSVGYLHSSPQEAIDAYDEAIRLNSGLVEAYVNRGNAKNDLGRYEEAIADLDKAVQLKPEMAEAYVNRGNAKFGLSRYEDAIADYNEAIRLKPDYAMAYSNRGNAKTSLGRYEDAIADYDEAIRLEPNNALAYNNRAETNLGLGRKDEARRDFETALRLANETGDETTANEVRGSLKKFFGGGDP